MRTKIVYRSWREVLTIYLDQKKPTARSKALFFDGPEAWSYGRHYKLAKIEKNRLLINAEKSSKTTESQKSMLVRLASDFGLVPVFVEEFSESGVARALITSHYNLETEKNNYLEDFDRLNSARRSSWESRVFLHNRQCLELGYPEFRFILDDKLRALFANEALITDEKRNYILRRANLRLVI